MQFREQDELDISSRLASKVIASLSFPHPSGTRLRFVAAETT
jgi:hypothetical protein